MSKNTIALCMRNVYSAVYFTMLHWNVTSMTGSVALRFDVMSIGTLIYM
jgi:hypothetical protein